MTKLFFTRRSLLMTYGCLPALFGHAVAGEATNTTENGGKLVKTDPLKEAGVRLNADIESRYKELRSRKKPEKTNDIGDIVERYIRKGARFDEAEKILIAANFEIATRPAKRQFGNLDSVAIVARRTISKSLLTEVIAQIILSPTRPGVLQENSVAEVAATILVLAY